MSEDLRHDRWTVRGLFGALGAYSLPVIGPAFPLSAVFALILIPVKSLVAWPKVSKRLFVLGLAGAAVLMASALAHGVTIPESAGFFAATSLFVLAGAKLTSNSTNAAQLLAFASLGTIIFFIVFGTDYTKMGWDFFWKYGIAFQALTVALWFAGMKTKRAGLADVILLAGAAVSLGAGFRSEATLCVVTLIFIMAKGRTGRFGFFRVMIAGGALIAAVQFISWEIERGVFGVALQIKTLSQLDTNGPGFLAGRVEPPLSFAAIHAHPIFGWGNVNAIDSHTISTGIQYAYDLGLRSSSAFLPIWIREDGHVSLHSVLLGSWAEGGLIAALLPLALLLLFIRGIWFTRGRWTPLVLMVCVQNIWDILFSPWTQNRAVSAALCAALVVWSIIGSKKPDPIVAQPAMLAQR